METITVTVKTYGAGGDAYLPVLLTDAVQTLSKDLLAIPEEYRASAVVDFEPHYELGESYPRMDIVYERPETPAEQHQRVSGEYLHWQKQMGQAKELVKYCAALLEGCTP